MACEINNVIAIVLAGGEASRMGGNDKGIQEFNGNPLVHHVVNRLGVPVERTIISANRNVQMYQPYCAKVVVDDNPRAFEGPMAGLSACLRFVSETGSYNKIESALISSCDTPKLPKDLLHRLYVRQRSNTPSSIVVAHDGRRGQALHCLIAREQWQPLIAAFAQGERSINRWQQRRGASYVDFADKAECFLNINDFAALSRAE